MQSSLKSSFHPTLKYIFLTASPWSQSPKDSEIILFFILGWFLSLLTGVFNLAFLSQLPFWFAIFLIFIGTSRSTKSEPRDALLYNWTLKFSHCPVSWAISCHWLYMLSSSSGLWDVLNLVEINLLPIWPFASEGDKLKFAFISLSTSSFPECSFIFYHVFPSVFKSVVCFSF